MIEAYRKEDRQRFRSSQVDLGLERLDVMANWSTNELSGRHGLMGCMDRRFEAEECIWALHSEGFASEA
jgi:hypothetical protein